MQLSSPSIAYIRAFDQRSCCAFCHSFPLAVRGVHRLFPLQWHLLLFYLNHPSVILVFLLIFFVLSSVYIWTYTFYFFRFAFRIRSMLVICFLSRKSFFRHDSSASISKHINTCGIRDLNNELFEANTMPHRMRSNENARCFGFEINFCLWWEGTEKCYDENIQQQI